MEDLSIEVVEAISDHYRNEGKEGNELAKDILFYLYHNTNNDKLQQQILNWFNAENYCITCGNKLEPYDYYETHTELDDNPREYFVAYLCPYCDRKEINDGNYITK